MNKTLRISFSLKNTYRVNSILFSLKQIPLLKKFLPSALYGSRGLKIFANVLSALWDFVSVFAGKFLYFIIMVVGIGMLYENVSEQEVFLHILFFLTIIGSYANTFLFNPTNDKYYAIILMRMNAKEYTLVNYGYSMLKMTVGFFPFSLWLGMERGIPAWLCGMIPFFVAGCKLTAASLSLVRYEKTGKAANENGLSKWEWIGMLLLSAAAYGLPAAGLTLPVWAFEILAGIAILLGILSIRKILLFSHYREMYQQLLTAKRQGMDQKQLSGQIAREQSRKLISNDAGIISRRRGFEFLNDLFIKRHQKILWRASKRTAAACLVLVLGCLAAISSLTELREGVNSLLMVYLPYFVFIMYAVNRGSGFTRALFMNCDHSLLTYSFYKQPKHILKLFQIRLREIIKINLLPAIVVGGGLSLLLYASGGTENPLNYAVIFISILSLSVFFSVHYLTIYYLLQPYNAGTEMKSGAYQLVSSGTYFICFVMMQLKIPTLLFGGLTIAFCVAYCVVASILVYHFAPKTFRIRN